MLKRNLGIIVLLMTCVSMFAQDNANIYGVNYFKPKAGQREAYLSGLKDHTKKHHSKGIMRVRTYSVVSGEKAGWIVRVSGPLTWSDIDKFQADTRSKAHMEHAAKYVQPYVEQRIGTMYWTPLEELNYNPDNSGKPAKMVRVTFNHINPGMSGEFVVQRKLIKEAHEKTNSDASWGFGRLIHGGDKHTYASFVRLDKWADMATTGPSLSTRFNEVYDNGAWGRFLKRAQKITKKRHDEMRIYMEEYSTR